MAVPLDRYHGTSWSLILCPRIFKSFRLVQLAAFVCLLLASLAQLQQHLLPSASASSVASAPSIGSSDVPPPDTGSASEPAVSGSTTSTSPDEAKHDIEELESMLGMKLREINERLGMVFEAIDLNHDGVLGHEELKAWMVRSKEGVQRKQVVAEMEMIDKDGNKKVTFAEMQAAYTDADGENVNEDTLNELRKRFNAVDKDRDGALVLDEIALLMNPGKDEELLALEVKEILNAQDKNRDGKISLEEFLATDDQLSPDDQQQYKTEFETYDLDKDGFIDESEIKQVVLEPNQQELAESMQEVLKLAPDGKLTKAFWNDNFQKFAISGLTDNGELLRFPTDYNLDLPFEDLPKPAKEELEEEVEHEEL